MTINDISPNLCEILNIKYNKKDFIQADELEKICKEAVDSFKTINGDTATVEITVRQLALLLKDWNKVTKFNYDKFKYEELNYSYGLTKT